MKEKVEKIGKKNIIIAVVFFVSIIIILFGGALIYNKYFYKKSYAEVEEIMLKASREYLASNTSMLPTTANGIVTITDSMLVEAELMKDIDSYIKNEQTSCSGSVVVTNINDGSYRYVPNLDCGEKYYKTTTFMDYINKNVGMVESGNGLYEMNGELVYRGDNVNNYIKLSNKTYRIVKFVDNHPVLIYTEKSEPISWDDRYNVQRDDISGINEYDVSRIREYLNDLYNSTGKEAFFTDNDKLMIVQYDLAIGKRSASDVDNSGALEKSKILTNQYIGLLPISDFINASTDINCVSVESKACANYNYLSKFIYNWWTVTASTENTYKVFRVANKSVPRAETASTMGYARPVIYLANDIRYVSGDGSLDNPYVIK